MLNNIKSALRKKIAPTEKHKLHAALEKLKTAQRFTKGSFKLFGKEFLYHDSLSFCDTYREIFEKQIYKFIPKGKNTILDCGANMGLSVLYFSLNYPSHEIIAFEPDDNIFEVLKENIQTYELKNVKLCKNAVWNKNEQLRFYTDSGMGGRVNISYINQHPAIVEALRLKDFINNDVEFLKIDIESAEVEVIKDCAKVLDKINYIFFEYHSFQNKKQELHFLLEILQEAGFHYHIKESGVRQQPFIDNRLICEAYDMAINIFGYKEIRQII